MKVAKVAKKNRVLKARTVKYSIKATDVDFVVPSEMQIGRYLKQKGYVSLSKALATASRSAKKER